MTDAPKVNSEWKDALQKAMHESLMGRSRPMEVQETKSTKSSGRRSSHSQSNASGSDVSDDDDASEDIEDTEDDEEEEEEDDDDEDDDDEYSDESTGRFVPTTPVRTPAPVFAPKSVPAVKSPRPPRHKPRGESPLRRRRAENEQLQREEKLELLGRLQHFIEEKGFKPFRYLSPEDSLEDIRYEFFRAKREIDKKRNIKLMQKGLVTVAAGIESANNYYSFLNLRLNGFSKSLLLSIRDYDEIFEELHWKYCDAISMPAEMKLALTLGSSLWFYHMSNGASESGAHASQAKAPPSVPLQRAPSRPTAATMAGPNPKVQGLATQPQRRMAGPRSGPPPDVFPSFPSNVGGVMSVGAPMDMGNLLSGLSMVQTLLNANN